MNLATIIQNESILRAGGPGSGRHKTKEIIEIPSRADFRKKLNEESKAAIERGRSMHRHGRFHQLKRAYGDYLYHQDREKFEVDYQNHINELKKKTMKAGGPGSGCTGPNCGRPSLGDAKQPNLKEMSHKDRVDYLKKYIPEHTIVGDKPKASTKPRVSPAERIYPHSGKGSMGVGKPADRRQEERLGKITGPAGAKITVERPKNFAPFYSIDKKKLDEEEITKEKAGQAEMRQWQQTHQPRLNRETAINKGDEVKTTKVTRAFDNDKLEFKNFKPGTTLTVLNVLPKVGNNPQLLSVQYPGRQGDIVHMPVTDVRFHRALEGIQEKPAYKIREEIGLGPKIRPSKIEQKVETPSGATYIKLKPETAGRPQGSGNIQKSDIGEHSLKGQFGLARGPKGNELKEIFTFEVSQKAIGQGTARATVWDANYKARTPQQAKNGTDGTTVVAWRDTKTKTGKVMEFDKDANGYIKIGSHPVQTFNNLGKMGGYLNQRYGISMKLPGESVAKKGRRR